MLLGPLFNAPNARGVTTIPCSFLGVWLGSPLDKHSVPVLFDFGNMARLVNGRHPCQRWLGECGGCIGAEDCFGCSSLEQEMGPLGVHVLRPEVPPLARLHSFAQPQISIGHTGMD